MTRFFRIFLIVFLGCCFLICRCRQAEANEIYSPVTAVEYCDFLNDHAVTDSEYYYDQAMSVDPQSACIIRSGTPGNYFYEVIEGRENFPICYVNKFDEEKYATVLKSIIANDEQNSPISCESSERSLKSNQSSFQVALLNTNQMLSLVTSVSSEKNDSLLNASATTIAKICLIFAGGMMLKEGEEAMISRREGSSIESDIVLAESPNRVSASTLEQKIGYNFKNPRLLNEALTHSSSLNERGGIFTSNERLEHLGDAVLQLIITEHLFHLFPNCNEGELTEKRAEVVSKKALQVHASRLQLGEYLMMGRGEEATGGRTKASILANSFEALIGAVYQDGGLEPARTFVLQHTAKEYLNDALEEIEMITNPKGHLQELLQAYGYPLPDYQLLNQTGLDDLKQFRCAVFCEGKKLGEGEGRTKKEAETVAAKKAVMRLSENIRKLEETSIVEENEDRAVKSNSIEKENEQGIYQSDVVTPAESTKITAASERVVLENTPSDTITAALTKAEFIVSQYRNKAAQAEAAGHFDQARCLNNSADFIMKASTTSAEGNTEEANLWLQAAREAVAASKAYIIANNKGERLPEGALIQFDSTYGVYLTADTYADIASYAGKAAEAKATGNQQISNLWFKAARELKMVIKNRQAHSAWNSSYRFATTVEYFMRAEDACITGHLEIADLWVQAARRSEIAAEKLSLLAQDLLNREKKDQLDQEARSSEYLARASERRAWEATARAAENEELADLWCKAAAQSQIAAENLTQKFEASALGNKEEAQRLARIVSRADTAADHLARIADFVNNGAEARAARYQPTADLWIQAAREAKIEMEYEDKMSEAYQAGDSVEVKRLREILCSAQIRAYLSLENARDETKKNPPALLPTNKTEKPRKSYFAKYR